MSTHNFSYIRWFDEITADALPLVGGKNASLGEMYKELSDKGIKIPYGFAVTASGYWKFIEGQGLKGQIAEKLARLSKDSIYDLQEIGLDIRTLIENTEIPHDLRSEICEAYRELCRNYKDEMHVAVRSSATAEDLPGASFAGQQESFLNIVGEVELLDACRRSFASLFTDRAISYRIDMGFDHMKVGLSIGIQKMVRSDLASAGVIFTLDTESGFQDVTIVSAAYGLGENVVKGNLIPDEYMVFKPTLADGFHPVISKSLGSKKLKMVYAKAKRSPTKNMSTTAIERQSFVLKEEEILHLARYGDIIEKHYSKRAGHLVPMDIEWAKDGLTGELFIVQARPETVATRRRRESITQYRLDKSGRPLLTGQAVGQGIGSGPVQIIQSATAIETFKTGSVLVTETTDPDWEPIMKNAAAIITERGGRTSHAAIVSRELGIPCVVGVSGARSRLQSGDLVTVSCSLGSAGQIYEGLLPFTKKELALANIPATKTHVMLNVGNPDNVFDLNKLPNDGVGLARMEFIIGASIGIHPLALIDYEKLKKPLRKEIDALTLGYPDKSQFFVERLAQGIGKIAAAFYPKPVIVRFSDFKTNEYASLIGGADYEPQEENPMIGWRGASRYYTDYKRGFLLECQALKQVREKFGLTNVKVMIPFCRTPDEGEKVLSTMTEGGLSRGKDGLEVYVMCEIPSNVLNAEKFLDVFDGFSIGSNDLTQLTLGLDRDSTLVASLFDERNPAVLSLIQQAIYEAKRRGKYIGICGDAPSTYPDFTKFLVQAGIESISLSPDAVLSGRMLIAEEENRLKMNKRAAKEERHVLQ